MTDTAGDRVQRYLLDGGDEDLRRLLGISEVHAEMTRTALRRRADHRAGHRRDHRLPHRR